MTELFLPSPSQGVWHIGPIPIRAYALCVLGGIVIAWFLVRRRWRALGGDVERLENLLLVTVVCGILGARLYYVLIEWDRFFGPGQTWYHIFYLWQGGLGIWGGVAVGALAAFLMARRQGLSFAVLADCFAPALPLAQAVGRFGNYFNQELYGRPTDLPWGLEIDPAHRVSGYTGVATFHPTFLYESLWDVALAVVLLLVVERRLHWGRGKLLASYVVGYALGRFVVESFRIDPVKVIGPLRINAWVTLALGLAGLAALLWLLRHRPGPNPPDAASTGPRTGKRAFSETVTTDQSEAGRADSAGGADQVAPEADQVASEMDQVVSEIDQVVSEADRAVSEDGAGQVPADG
ncbi:MAG: prolipoprotein diacylglyceryl transferase [Propionibacteriaceae bacterium]|jgi:prolipoprotein diacylglyceryl transferase|nr:prolipoprotein diacylglyceryl transferase [Propionibacteriaceae bacterium]